MYRASFCVWLVLVCGWPRAGWAERPSLARARKLARLATGLEQKHPDWSIMFDGRHVHVVGKRGQKVKASTVERVLRDQLDALRIEDWLTWAEGAPAASRRGAPGMAFRLEVSMAKPRKS
jgi:hypothetical protein